MVIFGLVVVLADKNCWSSLRFLSNCSSCSFLFDGFVVGSLLGVVVVVVVVVVGSVVVLVVDFMVVIKDPSMTGSNVEVTKLLSSETSVLLVVDCTSGILSEEMRRPTASENSVCTAGAGSVLLTGTLFNSLMLSGTVFSAMDAPSVLARSLAASELLEGGLQR